MSAEDVGKKQTNKQTNKQKQGENLIGYHAKGVSNPEKGKVGQKLHAQ